MNGKLMTVAPRMKDGVHRSYEIAGGKTMYTFDVSFSDGINTTSGVASSPNQTPKWTIGNEYTYNLEAGQYGNKIKGMKDANQANNYSGGNSDGGGKSSYNVFNPAEQHKINIQVAYEMATSLAIGKINSDPSTVSLTPEIINSSIEANAIELCVFLDEATDKNDAYMRTNALRRAQDQAEINNFSIKNRESLVARAREIHNFYKNA